jgi:hypothetical protein
MPKKPVVAIVDDDESACEGTMDLLKAMGFVAKGSRERGGLPEIQSPSLHRLRDHRHADAGNDGARASQPFGAIAGGKPVGESDE